MIFERKIYTVNNRFELTNVLSFSGGNRLAHVGVIGISEFLSNTLVIIKMLGFFFLLNSFLSKASVCALILIFLLVDTQSRSSYSSLNLRTRSLPSSSGYAA